MKKISVAMLLIGLSLFSIGEAIGVSFLRFENQFSGKGSSEGFFSKKINLAFDSDGYIYVSDAGNRTIQKLSPIGNEPTKLELKDGISLRNPGAIAVDLYGSIYVVDAILHHIEGTYDPKIYKHVQCVYKFSQDGELLHRYFTSNINKKPSGVTSAKFMIDAEGNTAFALGSPPKTTTLLIDVNSQNELFVLNPKATKIIKFSSAGEKLTTFGTYGSGDGQLDRDASDIEIDADDNILIADTGNNRLVKFDRDGEFVQNIGSRGRKNGQFLRPIEITTLANGDIWVKDSSIFKRTLNKLPKKGGVISVVSPSGVGLADRMRELDDGIIPDGSSTADLESRIQFLEEAEYYRNYKQFYDVSGKNRSDVDEDKKISAIRNTLYNNELNRIQRFDRNGRYVGRVMYETDKQSAELHDLKFLAIDAFGRIYLRDESELSIRQYSIEGFRVKLSHMNAFLKANANTFTNEFIEDYEDIDRESDLHDQVNQFRASENFLLSYNVSEYMNFMLANKTTYAEQDEIYKLLTRAEDSYNFGTKSTDNTLVANFKLVINPNPYRYKELNLYAERVDGITDLLKTGYQSELNRQKQIDDGRASSVAFGVNWDILRNVNLWLEYTDLNPANTSRNFVREFYDVSGELYQVFASRNRSRQFVSELTVKF